MLRLHLMMSLACRDKGRTRTFDDVRILASRNRIKPHDGYDYPVIYLLEDNAANRLARAPSARRS